jgi:hypothetical protein
VIRLFGPVGRRARALGLAVLCLTAAPAGALLESVPEYEMKAALLYNFGVFTEWPGERLSEATPSFDVCILGEDRFGASLEPLARRSVHGKPVVVRRLGGSGDPSGCHVLFIGESAERRLDGLLERAHQGGMLTVGESRGIAQRGAVVGLTLEQGRIVFEINRQSAVSAGLTVSSRVLSLARKVY